MLCNPGSEVAPLRASAAFALLSLQLLLIVVFLACWLYGVWSRAGGAVRFRRAAHLVQLELAAVRGMQDLVAELGSAYVKDPIMERWHKTFQNGCRLNGSGVRMKRVLMTVHHFLELVSQVNVEESRRARMWLTTIPSHMENNDTMLQVFGTGDGAKRTSLRLHSGRKRLHKERGRQDAVAG